MAKSEQVDPLLATLRDLIPDATEVIAEFAKLAAHVDEIEARAEQAERSLATVTAERDAALAELEVARNPKHPDAVAWMKHLEGCDVLPGGTYAPVFLSSVSRLFTERDAALAKLADAERDRDAWRAKWEALETTRAVCCDQMERERDEARAERDAAVDRLVGARVARESAIEDAEALRAKLAKTERVVEAARLPHVRCGDCGRYYVSGSDHTCDEPVGVAATAEPVPDFELQRMQLSPFNKSPFADSRANNACGYCDQKPCACPPPAREDGSTGAAATAISPKPYPRCEACDSSGIVAGPSGLDAIDCLECGGAGFLSPHAVRVTPYLTRAELVAAVRSAAAHVGGPPSRALDALADALEKP